jgi:hypothetical protein
VKTLALAALALAVAPQALPQDAERDDPAAQPAVIARSPRARSSSTSPGQASAWSP